jgi:LmbE family N-acetylglucosaminyl deacetylase
VMSMTGDTAVTHHRPMEQNETRPGRTLLGVWAHPDDETYLSAGLMQRVARTGGRVVCITATHGEHGTDDPDRWPPARLAAHRAVELEAALAHLGVHEHWFLDHADGACATVPPAPAVAALAAAIDEVRPDLVVTFGPDGITGHPDHVAVSRWTTDAWIESGQQGALVYATTTGAFARRHAALHERLGLFPPGYPRPAGDDELLFEVQLDVDELRRKRAALAAHASQTDSLVLAMGEAAFTRWWATESFRRPRPAELALAAAS